MDYRLRPFPGNKPGGVFKLQGQELVDCDPDGGSGVSPRNGLAVDRLPANNRLVIYELPASWTRGGDAPNDPLQRDVGTFRDVLALLDAAAPGGNFADVEEVRTRAHLRELGVNGLELLPPADSPFDREWGYATGNYFAADAHLPAKIW